MRNWINLLEAREWWDSPHDTLEQISLLRDGFVRNPGGDTYFEEIANELGYEGEDELELRGLWFDYLIDFYSKKFAEGPVNVWRAITVDSVDDFVVRIQNGGGVGHHWSWDKHCASNEYAPEVYGDEDIMLCGLVRKESVCWGETLMANFAHPYEREINISGPMQEVWFRIDDRDVWKGSNIKTENDFPYHEVRS